MSTPAAPVVSQVPPGPVPPAPAKKLNAIEIIEQDVVNFIRQREQAIANVHAIDGAIQATQNLLARLKAEAAKAEAEAKKLLGEAETEVKKAETAVVNAVEQGVDAVEKKI